MRTSDAARPAVSRREFLGQRASSAAAFGLGTAASAATRPATPNEENPWRYDVDLLRRVDPTLLRYEKVAGFAVDNPNTRRLALGQDGKLRIAAGKSVLVFSEAGDRLAEIKVGEAVRALGMGADNTLYAGLRDRVEVYDGIGQRLARWAPFSGRAFLTGLAPTPTEVWVADSGNRVVYRCDRDGGVQLRIGEKDPDRRVPGLILPSPFLDVALGGDGRLWLNNAGRHQVELYSRDGDFEGSWGRPGVAIDAFCGCCNPIALALFPDGRCVTAEKGLPRVKVYTADGRLESVVAGPDAFAEVAGDERDHRMTVDSVQDGLDVAVGADGRVWVLDLAGGTVQVFRPKAGSRRSC